MFRRLIQPRWRPLASAHVSKRYQSIIGIDLGTTNSAVAVVQGETPTILENEDGGRTTPSVVAYTNDGVLVGEAAKRQALINPHNTFFATKRLIGRKYTDDEVQRDIGHVPYAIVAGKNGDAAVQTESGQQLSPGAIGGDILNHMKEVAAGHGIVTNKAVVTVPAYFNDSQRQATRDCGRSVGLEVVRVVNEPTAAALAYGLRSKREGLVAVFDLGGGTFDISILDIEEGIFEVRATNGNTHLGGEDFDIALTNHLLAEIKDVTGHDLSRERLAVSRIREAAENCKMALDKCESTTVDLPFIHEQCHFHTTISADMLAELCQPLIDRTTEPVKKCLRDAQLKPRDIDEVLLVGGMTKMPLVQQHVKSLFDGKRPSTAVNPDEAVALGAAVQGAILAGQLSDVVLLDVTPLTLGIETYGGIFSPLIPRNTAVPCSTEQMFSTAVDGQTGVEVIVYQGERQLAKDNKRIGKFALKGIPPGPKGQPQIAVQFKIDPDGIINVTASDKTKYPEGTEAATASIQVSVDNSLSPEEIEKLVQQSEAVKEDDIKMRQLYEHCSRAEILCTDTDNALARFGKLMDAGNRDTIESQIASVRQKINDIRSGAQLHSPQVINDELNAMQKLCLTEIQKIASDQNKDK
ncbi:iron-sulfur cluster biogenesis chaperone, mitochondrial [Diutina catenulata]